MALEAVLAARDFGWEVRLVNLQEVLDPLDIFRKITRLRLQEIYNELLARGWTLGSAQLLPMMQTIIRIYHRAQVKLLATFWRERGTDMRRCPDGIPHSVQASEERDQVVVPAVDCLHRFVGQFRCRHFRLQVIGGDLGGGGQGCGPRQ